MTYNVPGEVSQGIEQDIVFGEKTLLQIGRDPSNDVVLASPNVSRFHAQVERVGQRYRVEDLRSSNGTFVNGERIDGSVWLKPEDTIRIGQSRFVVGKDQLAQYDDSNGLRVDAIGLNKWVRKDLNILQNISVSFQPREFIVVAGNPHSWTRSPDIVRQRLPRAFWSTTSTSILISMPFATTSVLSRKKTSFTWS
jgi:pSer/pThr/pTyr-binding forkhead associated (FHA) protein